MATVTLATHSIPGALGDILIDVRSSSRSASQPAVLIVHGFKGFKDYSFLPAIGERLARSGFTAINISVSGSGTDAAGDFIHLDRFARNTYSRELDDLAAVLDALRTGSLGVAVPSSIAVLGHSRGGGVGLMLARETPDIAAVVTWAAIARVRRNSDTEIAAWQESGSIDVIHQRLGIRMPMNWEIAEDALVHEQTRFNILRAARELERPWLLVHGEADPVVPIAEAHELMEASDGNAQVLLLPEADHTFGVSHPWSGHSVHTERVFKATVEFLGRELV